MKYLLAMLDALHAAQPLRTGKRDSALYPVTAWLDGVAVTCGPSSGMTFDAVLSPLAKVDARGFTLTGPASPEWYPLNGAVLNRHELRARIRAKSPVAGTATLEPGNMGPPVCPAPKFAGDFATVDNFYDALASVVPAVAREETRYAISCVQVTAAPAGALFCGTDGRRFHIASPTLTGHELTDVFGRGHVVKSPQLNLPLSAAEMLLRFRRLGAAIALHWDASAWVAVLDFPDGWRLTVWGHGSEKRFPEPTGLYTDTGPAVTIQAEHVEPFASKVRAVAKVDREMEAIELASCGTFNVRPRIDGGGGEWEAIPGAACIGKPFPAVILRGEYLADALDACNGPTTIRAGKCTNAWPVLVVGRNVAAVVMPIGKR